MSSLAIFAAGVACGMLVQSFINMLKSNVNDFKDSLIDGQKE